MSMRRFVNGIWCGLLAVVLILTGGCWCRGQEEAEVDRLRGTKELTWQGDVASRLVDGVDRFLLRKLAQSVDRRASFWHRDMTSAAEYELSVVPNRKQLAHMLGIRDVREPFAGLELMGTTSRAALVASGEHCKVYAVRWPVIRRMHGEGLLLVPYRSDPIADVIILPDADQTPEMYCGMVAGVPRSSQVARILAEAGCRVLVPILINRQLKARNGRAIVSTREFINRSEFELGRHLIGYELQKILACVDWLQREASGRDPSIAVVGYGEGGMLALYAAALDCRIDVTCVSGYFQSRETIWKQPIDRNVFGLLEQFGDAELATLVAPRSLIVEAALAPEKVLTGKGGAPASLTTPALDDVRAEIKRAQMLVKGLTEHSTIELVVSEDGTGPWLTYKTLQLVLDRLGVEHPLNPSTKPLQSIGPPVDCSAREARQEREVDDHNQWLLNESPYVRAEFMKKLDTRSLDTFEKSVSEYREFFREDVIGHFDDAFSSPNPRSRKVYDTDRWIGYEVVLDVFPDVIAYGILLVPKDIQPGQQRPVVVCQHGLEGRPQQLVAGNHRAYHDYAAHLADRGFVVFAPQNLYLFGDRFLTLQRKANPLKKTLFSVIVPQHEQILKWLASLPFVDKARVAFYGLSYGGKSAMRIPALVDGYCLSICSGDFNEWVWKNASTRSKYSYVWTGEYEIYEFDLGSTFNYAEMATLIAPRPFMVERGHLDGVAPDETVAYEFAKVRFLYEARLKLFDRCAIEWFVGPHEIHGQGTFDFLHEKLNWPKP